MNGRLISTKAPRLPTMGGQYDARTMTELLRVLNIYFAQIDNTFDGILGDSGGHFVRMPYGAFSDYTSQTLASTTTIGTLQIGQTDFSNNVSIVGGSAITVVYAGVYDLQFSVQLTNPTTGAEDATIWLRLNGVDVVGSAGLTSITPKHGSINGVVIVGWNYLVEMQPDDYLQIMWTVDSTDLSIVTLPAGTAPVHPSTASVVATMTFVSALPK